MKINIVYAVLNKITQKEVEAKNAPAGGEIMLAGEKQAEEEERKKRVSVVGKKNLLYFILFENSFLFIYWLDPRRRREHCQSQGLPQKVVCRVFAYVFLLQLKPC
jgi:hypothetical protein